MPTQPQPSKRRGEAPLDTGRELRADDVAACQAMLAAGSKSFSAASLLLPREVRVPAAVFYAFCRVADDAVDESHDPDGAVVMLRERLDRVFAGTPGGDPVDRALSVIVARHDLPRAVFDALIDGFVWDATGREYETLSEVTAYAARVASTIGVIMTLLMGVRDDVTLARACDLGVAMQLTNIARDVGEDARRGRLYLPRRWLREAGVDPEAFVAAPAFTPSMGEVVKRLLDEADRLYLRAEAGIARLPRNCRPSIRAARLIYADIGRVIAQRGYDSVSGRAVTTKGRKIWLLLRAMVGWRTAPRPSDEPLPEVRFLIEGARA